MTKIKLLNDGGYGDMEGFNFNAVLEANITELDMVRVLGKHLLANGARIFAPNVYYSFFPSEFTEVV